MAPLTPGQAQVIEPIMTGLAQDYRPDVSDFVHQLLFPLATARTLAAKLLRHDKSGHVEVNIERSDTGMILRAQRGYSDEDVALVRRTLAGEISQSDMEQAANIPGAPIRLREREVVRTMEQVSLQIEIAAAKLATTVANYPSDHSTALSQAARWDKDGADPQKVVMQACRLIQRKTGKRPNLLVIGSDVYDRLIERDDVRDEAKYVRSLIERPLDAMDLAKYFKVGRVAVAEAQKATKAAAAEFSWVWPKNFAWLGRTEMGEPMDMVSARITWGATLRLEGYPRGLEPWYDNNHTCWVYPFETYDTPAVVTNTAAYLWRTVVD